MLIPVATMLNVCGFMPGDTTPDDRKGLGERLRGYIRATGKTQAKIAEEVGTDPTYMSQLVNGRVNWVNSEYFRPLSRVLGLSDEEIYDLNPGMVFVAHDSNWLGSGRRQGMNFDFSREDPYAKPQSQLPLGHQMISPGKVLIPIYGTATAGSPADFLSEGNIMNYAVIDQAQLRNGNTIAITVSGMSMQPTFTDSETVLIDKSLTDLEDRGVYLICVEGQGVCLKRARLRRGAWWLTSDNPDHNEFQADEATVIGRVYFAQPAGRAVS